MPSPRHAIEQATPLGLLRLFEPGAAELQAAAPLLSAWYNEPVNRALLTNQSDLSPADVVARFDEFRAAGDRAFLLTVDGALVGDGDLRGVTPDHAELALLIGPRDQQARGLGTRFCTLALALAFGPLAVRKVFAAVIPANRGSLRMFEKLGFQVDASPEARRCADEPDDVCLSLEAAAFRSAHGETLAQVRMAER